MQDVSPSRATLRFSDFEVDLRAGELRKQGMKVKLQEQPFQVLQILLEQPGDVVPREELQRRIWPADTFVDFDHGLYNAIKRLREALGDTADAPRYIETLPKRGYKFIAALEPQVVRPESETRQPKTAKYPPWRRKTTIAIAACIVVAGLLYPWIAPQIERLSRLYQLQRLTVVPLTTMAGIASSPSFSPDGSQIAFVWSYRGVEGNDLYVKLIGTADASRLTYSGYVGPATWSPDGRSIAFERCISGDCGVFLISPLGGPERKIDSVGFWAIGSLNWSPDGKRLALLDVNSASDKNVRLFVLSLDSMERVPVKTDCTDVRTPAFSPRGDYLAWSCAKVGEMSASICNVCAMAGLLSYCEGWTVSGRWHGHQTRAGFSSRPATSTAPETYGKSTWLDPTAQKNCRLATMLWVLQRASQVIALHISRSM